MSTGDRYTLNEYALIGLVVPLGLLAIVLFSPLILIGWLFTRLGFGPPPVAARAACIKGPRSRGGPKPSPSPPPPPAGFPPARE